jgi:hypothetical protein
MKLDIEGSEESVLPWLHKCDALCGLDYVYMELHASTRTDASARAAYLNAVAPFRGKPPPAIVEAKARAASRGERCNITLSQLDDESYMFDIGIRRWNAPPAPWPQPLVAAR